jgi:hypothetical protein
MTLPVIGDDVVHLDAGTYMWVHVTHFLIDPDQDNQSILVSLTRSPGYQHDYASPLHSAGANAPSAPRIHGRWRLDAIHWDLFDQTTPEAAQAQLYVWANDQDWTDPNYSQPRMGCNRHRAGSDA